MDNKDYINIKMKLTLNFMLEYKKNKVDAFNLYVIYMYEISECVKNDILSLDLLLFKKFKSTGNLNCHFCHL